MEYLDFLKRKMDIAPESGFDIDISEVNPNLKPHQRVAVQWSIKGGRRAVFKAFGLGKTIVNLEICRIIVKYKGGKALIVLPLGVKQEFKHDAVELLGMAVPQYVTCMNEVREAAGDILMTNYERVRDGDIDPTYFTVCTLDEAAVLRSYGSDTYQTFMVKFKSVKYKFVFTATPSPNRFKELIHYAAFLEIMDSGQALTRFFQRDSTKANNLTLYPHREDEFWLWCSSWALWITTPSDLGPEFSDEGYDLPPMEVRYHEIPVERELFSADRDGQMKMQDDEVVSLPDAMKEKRRSINERVAKMAEILEDISGEDGFGKQQAILREEQRERKSSLPGVLSSEQRQDRPGKAESVYEGVSQNVPKKEDDSRTKGRNEQETKREIRYRSRIQGECSSRRISVSQETSRKENGLSVENGIWNNKSPIRPNARIPRWRLCDLRKFGTYENKITALCRPRPRDWESERDSLSPLQFRDRAFQGQSGTITKSNGLPEQIVIWCELNEEQKEIEKALKKHGISFTSLYGSDSIEYREEQLSKWKNGETKVFLSKPEMYGAGVNLQQAHSMIFIGISYEFESFIQAIHRVYRFLQKSPVTIHIIYTSREKRILQVLLKKWEQHKYLTKKMTDIIKKYGLSSTSMMEKMTRTMGVKRVEVKGKNFTAVNNDSILEFENLPDNYFDLLHTSIPFGNHYEYSASYNDFGFNPDTEAFMEQMDFLTPNLLRTLKPGRVFACHVKDRVLFGNTTGTGMPTMEPFHALCIQHYMKHGFQYFGMITVVTDVVRENNQTYRLGWSEQCKDGTKMGVGCPEYILLFRKLPTDTSNAYADIPVTKTKEEYTRAQWQIDAHGFWRSSGDRLLTKSELENIPVSKLQAAYLKYSRNTVYNYQEHVELAKKLDIDGKLPASFMVVAPGSWSDQVWDDILRMKTLNAKQTQKRLQNHVCLAEGSLVLTQQGYKHIENIGIGDLVLTHKGSWKPVIAKRCTGINPVIRTHAQGVANLITTPDHKLWARTTNYIRRKDGMKIAIPDWVEAQNTVGNYINLKLPPIVESSISSEEWWLIGRWLADGHVGTYGDYFISVGKHKNDEFLKHACKFTGTHREGTAIQYRLKNLSLGCIDMLKKCGHGAENKQLPFEAISLNKELSEALLQGYLSGDGCKTANQWLACSVSRALLLGMAMVAQRARDVVPSVFAGKKAGKHEIQGRIVNQKQLWVMSWRESNHHHVSEILEDGAWKKVSKIEELGEATTWSIQVADDASYTAEGCIVKNCPLQLDIVERIINRYSSEGELAGDPFGGLMTVPKVALDLGRKGWACELNTDYFRDGVGYLKASDEDMKSPTLFDFFGDETEGAD